MSTLTISSPGVQINEVDLSLVGRPLGATDVLVTGFAPQGPTEEIVNVGSVSEFESIFGTPTNGAERYLYYTAKQILSQSPANLMVTRLPYGPELGDGYTNSYSALVYPISSNRSTYEASTEYKLMPPVSILLTDDEYFRLISNDVAWQDSPYSYVLGDQTYTFGNLTNATFDITEGQRIYGVETIALSTLSISQLQSRGLYSVDSFPLTGAQIYLDATWNVYDENDAFVNTTSIYNQVSATTPAFSGWRIELDSIQNWYGTLSADPLFTSQYGEVYSTTQTITSYQYDHGFFLNTIASANDLLQGKGGLILINTSKTAVNNLFEGYYVGIADNSNFNPATDYDSLNEIKAVNSFTGTASATFSQNFVTVPNGRLNFTLTQTASAYVADSVSKTIEQFPTSYSFSTKSFIDSVVLMVFKLKTTQYNQDTVQLSYSVSEAFAGSFNSRRTQNNQSAGTPPSFYMDTVINNQSINLRSITNPYMATTGTWTNPDGTPAKTVRVHESAKKAYSTGVYSDQGTLNNKDLGKVDLKLKRFLDIFGNDDSTNVDVIADAGLSTIWATAVAYKAQQNVANYVFDETYTPLDIDSSAGIGNTSVNVTPTGLTIDAYKSITNNFVSFAEARRDHVFIADPLRQIFVRGQGTKVSSRKGFVFSNEIYWPLNNIFNDIQSSYVTTYGNWIKTNDAFTSKAVWIPNSGYAAAIIAKSSQTTYPWIAPAGFNRGTLTNVLDIASNPTQKQRDLLYKINVNPITFFNQDGYVIFGQKTMYRKPSAFDRINVRRLFLTLEKMTQRLLKYFVFEPNSFATRNRLKGALIPVFDQAKLNDGCYDYLIVCDTTNNTPVVIDNNELRISIYIQPVRAAEFILADFIATRTGVSFSELIAGGQS